MSGRAGTTVPAVCVWSSTLRPLQAARRATPMSTHTLQTGDRGPGELAYKARIAEVLGLTPQRVSQLEGQAGFPAPYAELQIGKIWLLDDVFAYRDHRQKRPPPRLRLGPADKRWKQAEELVIARINTLPGWRAANANEVGRVQPGWDVLATHQPTGRTVTVSVKSISTVTSARRDFAIGRAFDKHRAQVFAFVDATTTKPWPVWLAGYTPVVELAIDRHREYQRTHGKPQDKLNTWSPKISQRLLNRLGARENWTLLDEPEPERKPPVPEELRQQARDDAPAPRGRWS